MSELTEAQSAWMKDPYGRHMNEERPATPIFNSEQKAFFRRMKWNFPDGAEFVRGWPAFSLNCRIEDGKYVSSVAELCFNGNWYSKEFKYDKSEHPLSSLGTKRRIYKDLRAWLKTLPSGSGKSLKNVDSFSKKP